MIHLVGSYSIAVDRRTTDHKSAHMGIRTLSWLPRLPPFHTAPPRLPRLRRRTQETHNQQTKLADARILLLAHLTPSPTRRPLRAPLLHSTPRQPPRMGNTLAARIECKKRSHGGRGRLVRASRRSEHCASSVAVCEPGGAQGEEGDVVGGGGVGRYGAQDRAVDTDDEESDPDSDAVESCYLSEHRP